MAPSSSTADHAGKPSQAPPRYDARRQEVLEAAKLPPGPPRAHPYRPSPASRSALGEGDHAATAPGRSRTTPRRHSFVSAAGSSIRSTSEMGTGWRMTCSGRRRRLCAGPPVRARFPAGTSTSDPTPETHPGGGRYLIYRPTLVSLTSGDLAGLVVVEKHRVDDMLSCPRVGNLALARRCQVCVVSVVSLVALTSDDASCLILKRTYKYNTVCTQIHFLNNE